MGEEWGQSRKAGKDEGEGSRRRGGMEKGELRGWRTREEKEGRDREEEGLVDKASKKQGLGRMRGGRRAEKEGEVIHIARG